MAAYNGHELGVLQKRLIDGLEEAAKFFQAVPRYHATALKKSEGAPDGTAFLVELHKSGFSNDNDGLFEMEARVAELRQTVQDTLDAIMPSGTGVDPSAAGWLSAVLAKLDDQPFFVTDVVLVKDPDYRKDLYDARSLLDWGRDSLAWARATLTQAKRFRVVTASHVVARYLQAR